MTFFHDDAIIAAARKTQGLSVSAFDVAGQNSGSAAAGFVSSAMGSGNHNPNVSVTGNSGPLSYSWAPISQAGAVQSVSAQSFNPVFSATVSNGVPSIVTWRVTVTDTLTLQQGQATLISTLNWTETAPPALSVTANDVFASDSGPSVIGNVTSGSAVVTITNGSGNYSYSWVKVAQVQGPNASSLASADNIRGANFQGRAAHDVDLGDGTGDNVSDWRITVTDLSTGQQAQDTIRVRLSWFNTNA